MSDGTNPLFDPATDNAPISDETQEIVNTPIADPTGTSDDDRVLLNKIIQLVDDGKINLYQPSTLINQEVYDGLSDEVKGKVDQQSFNMLSTIRELHAFNASEFTNDSFQFQNMIHRLRLQKEATENESGDVFVF
ncbi:MAG: hypothetical protein ABII07_06180 [Patescibacteria group bacterium]|nr:hypothetical protein [Patescibacteria group bacterium]